MPPFIYGIPSFDGPPLTLDVIRLYDFRDTSSVRGGISKIT